MGAAEGPADVGSCWGGLGSARGVRPNSSTFRRAEALRVAVAPQMLRFLSHQG